MMRAVRYSVGRKFIFALPRPSPWAAKPSAGTKAGKLALSAAEASRSEHLIPAGFTARTVYCKLSPRNFVIPGSLNALPVTSTSLNFTSFARDL